MEAVRHNYQMRRERFSVSSPEHFSQYEGSVVSESVILCTLVGWSREELIMHPTTALAVEGFNLGDIRPPASVFGDP